MRSIEEYQRIADNYDIAAFINGRDISAEEIINYVSDNMPWVKMADFMKSVLELVSMGNQITDSLIVALLDYAKYQEITLAELDTYLEI